MVEFGDVWVSMPSFTWIKMYPAAGSTAQQYPHNTLTCNVVDQSQMIIIGGVFPLDDTTCDTPEQFGSHNLDMGKQNPSDSPWYLYRQNLTSYVVPDNITAAIGGGSQGGATKTKPDGGFDSPDLNLLMTRQYTASGREPTRDVSGNGGGSSGSRLPAGAIVGIAIGCGAAAILLLAGCCFFIRKRKHRCAKPGPLPPAAAHSQAAYSPSMNNTPWSPQSSHHTPASPHSHHPPFQYRPSASIPHRASPAELAGDEAGHEIYDPHAVVTPHSAEPSKYDGMTGTWASIPSRDIHSTAHSPAAPPSAYSGGGYGPSELGANCGDGKDMITNGEDLSPRHQTYYHK